MKARLEMLAELFQAAYKINEDMANETNASESDYERGINSGIRMANKMYERRIKRLEQLVSQLDSYMEEDVILSGTNFEKEVI